MVSGKPKVKGSEERQGRVRVGRDHQTEREGEEMRQEKKRGERGGSRRRGEGNGEGSEVAINGFFM